MATNASAYYLAAKAKKAAGDVLGTIVSLSQAITIKEDFAEALLLRAEMMLSTRDYKDGLQDNRKGDRFDARRRKRFFDPGASA